MEEDSFEDFCKKKNIDPEKFKQGDQKMYNEWEFLFSQVHPNSFVEQKKFLINKVRRDYLLKDYNA